jgi:cytochrome c-type biogenesis protein CcmE
MIGIAVIVVAVGVLLWFAVGRGSVYYYTVAEILVKGQASNVRVSGELEGGSFVDEGSGRYTFVIHDREQNTVKLTVDYTGALPDAFKNEPGAEIVAEGDFGGGSTFSARTLITKCPSKYEAAP